MKEDSKTTLESRIAQACHYVDEVTGGISPPLQFSTTFSRDPGYDHVGNYSYSRADNPSWEVLEKVCAELDGGAEAKCFASGMAAVCAFFETVNIEPIFKAASFFKKLGGILFHNEPAFFMSPQHDGEVKNGSQSRDDKAQHDR